MSEALKNTLEMRHISIEFPGVKALQEVNFSTSSGLSHALVGANGAGKSTLMKVLVGAYSHYSGEIFLNGERVHIRSPKDAKNLGIQIVYQEVDTALIPYLSVAENIILEKLVNDMGKKQLVDWKDIHRQAGAVLDKLNLKLSTRKIVSELTLAEKQMILIARAITKQCQYLILDEPTAPLSNLETGELFRVVEDLKREDVGIIFISHRLPELFQICDVVTVMRDGQSVVTKEIKDTDQNELVEFMLGRKFDAKITKDRSTVGKKIFEVNGFSDREKIKDIDLYVRTGEVIGLAGLVGAGKTELCRALFGATQVLSGTCKIDGCELNIKAPHQAVKCGLALVPEERRKEGILVNESVVANISITDLGRFCRSKHFLNFKAEKAMAKKMIDTLKIKTPSENSKVAYLSGGNQQKVAVGKWLITDARVYIFDEPTKGVDVGAKKDIFDLIGQLVKDGKSVIYASCELNEILGITDRVYVMYDGMITKELETQATSEEEILFYATGGR